MDKKAVRAFMTGFVSAFDIGLRVRRPRRLVKLRSPADDGQAIAGDWQRVGDALWEAAGAHAELSTRTRSR